MRRLLLFAFLLASCTAQPALVSPRPNSADVLAGRKLFDQHCAMCHGLNATGTRYAPSLHAPEVQESDRAMLFQFITNGDLRNGMPAWSRLPDERRWQIVSYLKSLD